MYKVRFFGDNFLYFTKKIHLWSQSTLTDKQSPEKQPGEYFEEHSGIRKIFLIKSWTWSQTDDWKMWYISGMRSKRLWSVKEATANIWLVYEYATETEQRSKLWIWVRMKAASDGSGMRTKTTCKWSVDWKTGNNTTDSARTHISCLYAFKPNGFHRWHIMQHSNWHSHYQFIHLS